MKAILEELEGLEVLGSGRRILGWGLTGVVLGLGLAAVALVFESYFSWDDTSGEGKNGAPGGSKRAKGDQPARTAGPKATGKPAASKKPAAGTGARSRTSDAAFREYLAGAEGPLRELAEALDAELLGLGDDAERKVLKRYVAYKRAGANFACVAVRRSAQEILVYLRLDPAKTDLLPFMRDVTAVGHIGTGDLELRLARMSELGTAREHLARSYAAV